MKSAEYVTWIRLCKHYNFGKKLSQIQRYRIFPTGLLFGTWTQWRGALHTKYNKPGIKKKTAKTCERVG